MTCPRWCADHQYLVEVFRAGATPHESRTALEDHLERGEGLARPPRPSSDLASRDGALSALRPGAHQRHRVAVAADHGRSPVGTRVGAQERSNTARLIVTVASGSRRRSARPSAPAPSRAVRYHVSARVAGDRLGDREVVPARPRGMHGVRERAVDELGIEPRSGARRVGERARSRPGAPAAPSGAACARARGRARRSARSGARRPRAARRGGAGRR